jgi:hypothetical protein
MPFLNGVAGSKGRGGMGGGSVARRDMWKEGDGGGGWSQLMGGIPTDHGPAAAHAGGMTLSEQGRGEEEGEERREAGRVGRPGEKGKWAEPEETGGFFIYSSKIQTSSNGFDQKVDLLGWKKFQIKYSWKGFEIGNNFPYRNFLIF